MVAGGQVWAQGVQLAFGGAVLPGTGLLSFFISFRTDTETAAEQCYQASQHDFKPRQWSLRREVRCEHGFRSLLESGFWTFPKFQKLRLWNPLPERVTLPSVWACSEIQNKKLSILKDLNKWTRYESVEWRPTWQTSVRLGGEEGWCDSFQWAPGMYTCNQTSFA